MLDLQKPETVKLLTPSPDRIILVGCGGTGSHIASGLMPLVLSEAEKGHRIDLVFMDGDTVEAKNVGRQLFTKNDIGKNKAQALASRLGIAYNTVIEFLPRMAVSKDFHSAKNQVIIGAVDTVASRREIDQAMRFIDGNTWWLDCGNDRHSGQVCLGNLIKGWPMERSVTLGMTHYLPAPSVQYPNIVTVPKLAKPAKRAKKAKSLSCAELTLAGEQGLMVNRMVAAWALTMLTDLLAGTLQFFAVEFNAMYGRSTSRMMNVASIAEAWGESVEIITKGRKE